MKTLSRAWTYERADLDAGDTGDRPGGRGRVGIWSHRPPPAKLPETREIPLPDYQTSGTVEGMSTHPPTPTPPADLDPTDDITHADVVTLTAWMAREGSTADEVAYAVERPWQHRDWIRLARAGHPMQD